MREQPRAPGVVSIVPSIEEMSDHQLSSIRDIHQQLPNWLASASDSDTAAYSRYLIDLAHLHTHYQGETFQDGIPAIRDYARTQLQSRIRAPKENAHLNLTRSRSSSRARSCGAPLSSPIPWTLPIAA